MVGDNAGIEKLWAAKLADDVQNAVMSGSALLL